MVTELHDSTSNHLWTQKSISGRLTRTHEKWHNVYSKLFVEHKIPVDTSVEQTIMWLWNYLPYNNQETWMGTDVWKTYFSLKPTSHRHTPKTGNLDLPSSNHYQH